MNTIVPPIARKPSAANRNPLGPVGRRAQYLSRFLLHPLIAICAVQAALSLTLVWSNTAFGDEAEYLWVGNLETAHWLHGTPWPSAWADQFLSGSPAIYPPLGALAGSLGGLAGARILSLVFMLSATVLLYLTAWRLFGRTTAIAATVVWVLSEPAIRLAYATYDPLAVLLTALSAWFITCAAHRRGQAAFTVAAAAALALANATAYSGIVIDLVVVAFAFLVWLPRMHARQVLLCMACFVECSALFFALLIIASHSSSGLMATLFTRPTADHQDTLVILKDSWDYSGLVVSAAVIGAVTGIAAETKQHAALLVLLGCAAFIVPAAQLYDQTGWSLDEHLTYGIWFAAIAAGYAYDKLIRWLPGASRQLAAFFCVIVLVYPTANAWESAWQVFHSWANARSFITQFAPVAAQSRGFIYTAGQDHIAEYYTPQGHEWTRWTEDLSLDPVKVPPSDWESYYSNQLRRGNYGVVVLFYSTTFSSGPQLSLQLLLSPPGTGANRELLGLVGESSGKPGLPALTLALEKDPAYRRVAVGPYNSAHEYGIYAIWQKVRT
jgi:hypothetical protein